MIGAVNCCWVWYKLPEGIKAAWSLNQAYYYHHYTLYIVTSDVRYTQYEYIL